MGVEGCTKCIKYLLFVFNFVFWLAGGVILGVALWLRHDPQTTSLLYLELGFSSWLHSSSCLETQHV